MNCLMRFILFAFNAFNSVLFHRFLRYCAGNDVSSVRNGTEFISTFDFTFSAENEVNRKVQTI